MTTVLQGKVAIVTGANQGLGLEIARKYLENGAKVVVCARDTALLDDAATLLRRAASAPDDVLPIAADVSRRDDVQAVVSRSLDNFGRLDVLVSNAGVSGPKGAAEETSWDEWVHTIEVNLFGSVLMCREVLPHFKAQRSGKIVQLSGGGATSPLPWMTAYAVSKAAVVRFIETLAHEVRDQGIEVNSIAPGALNTRMLDEVLAAGPEKVGRDYYEKALKQRETGGASFDAAAELAVFLGSPKSNGISGRLISAVWDNWSVLPDHVGDIASTDVYTLRRIVPEDRELGWG